MTDLAWVPSRRQMAANGVRESVAREYRRLLVAGVSAEWAVVLARAPGHTMHRRHRCAGRPSGWEAQPSPGVPH